MFVDSHCHLDFPDLKENLDDVLDRARAVGVGCFVSVGTTTHDIPELAAIAAKYPDVFYTVGVHPHEASKREEQITADDLVHLADAPKVVALGEAGLDYFYDLAKRDDQERIFREHLRASFRTGLPLSIHTRDAEDDTLRIIHDEMRQAGQGTRLNAILHCFSSHPSLAEECVKLGAYVSFSGILTFKKSDEVRAAAKAVPMDRLLIETDSPYLAPVPMRGKPCEPSYVVHTAKMLAEVKGVSLKEIEDRTTENFFRLFTKVPR